MIEKAERPIFYAGGGVINAGPAASELLTEIRAQDRHALSPTTLMGLGAYPASGPQFLGMLGMHGTYEANMAMHDCDVMMNIGARFDDRVTGPRRRVLAPLQEDRTSTSTPARSTRTIMVDLPILGDVAHVLEDMLAVWEIARAQDQRSGLEKLVEEDRGVEIRRLPEVRADSDKIIKPQYAMERLYALTKDREDVFITTEVGQHQMWAAQYLGFEDPNRWMTSGGLGTMGYGFPAALGVQIAHPDALVIDVAGEASTS